MGCPVPPGGVPGSTSGRAWPGRAERCLPAPEKQAQLEPEDGGKCNYTLPDCACTLRRSDTARITRLCLQAVLPILKAKGAGWRPGSPRVPEAEPPAWTQPLTQKAAAGWEEESAGSHGSPAPTFPGLLEREGGFTPRLGLDWAP